MRLIRHGQDTRAAFQQAAASWGGHDAAPSARPTEVADTVARAQNKWAPGADADDDADASVVRHTTPANQNTADSDDPYTASVSTKYLQSLGLREGGSDEGEGPFRRDHLLFDPDTVQSLVAESAAVRAAWARVSAQA